MYGQTSVEQLFKICHCILIRPHMSYIEGVHIPVHEHTVIPPVQKGLLTGISMV